MFRFALLGVGLIAIGALLAGGLGTAGAWVLAPLFIIGKLFLILLLVGVIGGFFWRSYDGPPSWGPRGWRRPPGRSQEPRAKSRDEQFEDWHRMAHAREEVDSWVFDDDEDE